VAFGWIGCLVLWCVCICLCLLVERVWVFCVVDLLLFLSLVCLNDGCGPRKPDAGLLQGVSDSSTVALSSCGWLL